MKPSVQFQMMISMLFETRQKSVTNADLIKHRNNTVDFYAVTRMNIRGSSVTSQTQPFSEQEMIEISSGGSVLTIGDERKSTEYRLQTPLEFTLYEGKGLLHWTVRRVGDNVPFTVVKLMSPDGTVQIKLISADQQNQVVYNVVELPSHFQR